MTTDNNEYLEKAISRKENLERRKNYKNLPYVFDDVDSDLSRNRNARRGNSAPSGDRARLASRDAWDLLNTRR